MANSVLEQAMANSRLWAALAIAEIQWLSKPPKVYESAIGLVNRVWQIAEQWLVDHCNRLGRIEISFGFCAEWDVTDEMQRTYAEMREAWTLDGAQPSALMANTMTAKKGRRKNK